MNIIIKMYFCCCFITSFELSLMLVKYLFCSTIIDSMELFDLIQYMYSPFWGKGCKWDEIKPFFFVEIKSEKVAPNKRFALRKGSFFPSYFVSLD